MLLALEIQHRHNELWFRCVRLMTGDTIYDNRYTTESRSRFVRRHLTHYPARVLNVTGEYAGKAWRLRRAAIRNNGHNHE